MAGIAWRAAREIIKSRRLLKNGSAPTRSAPMFRCARVTNAVSISSSLLAFMTSIRCWSARAAASTSPTLNLRIRRFRVHKHTDRRGSRDQIAQKLDSLGLRFRDVQIYSGCVASWPIEARDKAKLDRVSADHKHDWNC